MSYEELERQASKLTVQQMKEQLGLDRTVRGHTKMRRSEIVKAWISNRNPTCSKS